MKYKPFEHLTAGDSLYFLSPHTLKPDTFVVRDVQVFTTWVSIQYYVHNKAATLNEERATRELVIRGKGKSMVLVPYMATLMSTTKEEIDQWITHNPGVRH